MRLVGTGHRLKTLGGYKPTPMQKQLRQVLLDTINSTIRPDTIISGMAIGFDQWLARAAVELNIPFIAAIPFEGQERKWPYLSQTSYHTLLKKAHKVVIVDREAGYISDKVAPGVYHASKLQRRNEWMIDQLEPGDRLLSMWNEKRFGGTWNCIQYFRRNCPQNVTHYNIHPAGGVVRHWSTDPDDDVPF